MAVLVLRSWCKETGKLSKEKSRRKQNAMTCWRELEAVPHVLISYRMIPTLGQRANPFRLANVNSDGRRVKCA